LDAEAAQDAEDAEAARLVMADGEPPIPFAQFEAELEAERDAERASDGQAHREAA
jgi:nucleoid-associated protein YgaU